MSFIAKFQQSKFQSLHYSICRKVTLYRDEENKNSADKKWAHANLLILKQKKSKVTGRMGVDQLTIGKNSVK